jgi:predicted CopG family antitoxin
MAKVVKLSDEVIRKLDQLKHPGQSYDGAIRELLEKVNGATQKKIAKRD